MKNRLLNKAIVMFMTMAMLFTGTGMAVFAESTDGDAGSAYLLQSGAGYDSLQEAIDNAADGDVITATRDVTENAPVVLSGKKLSLVAKDGEVKLTLSEGDPSSSETTCGIKVENGAALTLGSGDGSGSVIISGSVGVYGELTLNDGAEVNSTAGTCISVISGGKYTGNGGKVSTGGFSALSLKDGEVTAIRGGEYSAEKIALYGDGKIETISGGVFRAQDSGASLGKDAEVREISGGRFIATGGGINGDECGINVGSALIRTISGGEFVGGEDSFGRRSSGIYIGGGGEVRTISGGTFRGTYGIQSSEIADGSAHNVVTITGGSLYGATNAVKAHEKSSGVVLEPNLSNATGVIRFRTDGNAADSQAIGKVTIPDGYHMSVVTASADDEEGDFHFLMKDNTVVYDGNGHKLAEDSKLKAADGINGDDPVIVTGETASVTVLGNGGSSDLHYDEKNSSDEEMYFVGWNTEADGSGTAYKAGDVVNVPAGEEVKLYAQWGWTVTFDTDGGDITPDDAADGSETAPADQHVVDGGTAEKPADPVRTGHSFVDWFRTIGGQIAETAYDFTSAVREHIDLIAKWDAKRYKVTYKYTGNVPEDASDLPDEEEYAYGSEVSVEEAASAAGYTFSGWSSDGVTVTDGIFTMPDNAVKFTGTFEANKDTPYKVEHYKENLEGGYELADTDNKTGETGAEVTVDTADAKDYEGFTLSEDAGTDERTGVIAGDGSLVLKLYYDRDEYTITFETQGGSEMDSITQLYGSEIEAPENPEKEGYTFEGWDTEIPRRMPASDMTITANWEPNNYTVKFDANSGSGSMEDESFTYDEEKTLTENAFTKTGYSFDGWNTVASPTDENPGMSYDNEESVENLTAEDNGEVTLYAQWTANYDTPYIIEHYLEKVEGGYKLEDVEEMEGEADTVVTADPLAYEGFNLNEDAEGAVRTGVIAGDGSLVLRLYYSRNECTITYKLNGGSYNGNTADVVETYKFSEEVILPEAPEREGYEFVEWHGSSYQPGDSFIVEEDHTFQAIWKVAKSTPDNGRKKGVDTGDSNDLPLMLGLFGASALGLLYMLIRRVREQ